MCCPSSNSHPNTLVRQCTARHLVNLVEKVGAARLLSGIKDLTERILHAVTKFVQDVSPNTRYVVTGQRGVTGLLGFVKSSPIKW